MSLALPELNEVGDSGSVSSNEDFWMFFTFAMILLVFVLMNYVNYLSNLVVKPQDEPVETPSAESEEPASGPLEVRVYVVPDGAGAYYLVGQDPKPLDLSELRHRLATVGGADDDPSAIVDFLVQAPGDVAYQHVFDAVHLAKDRQEWTIRLVHEELVPTSSENPE